MRRVAILHFTVNFTESLMEEGKTVSFIMMGGFLGAGKTTLISRIARHYSEQGKKIGLVTNDQAYGLVDTEHLRSEGFEVGEVPGACFCCKFNDLVETAESLARENLPDIIIAEPVGSCTDLMATVIEPMRQIYGERFELGPLTVLLKPEHGRKILSGKGKIGFSPKAAYIFEKQIEEANIVAVNKMDKLNEEDRQELVSLVEEKYPGKKIVLISGRTGENVDQLLEAIEDRENVFRTTMDVDYDLYAEGEAELGWFNCQVSATAAVGEGMPEREVDFDLDHLVLRLVARVANDLVARGLESAHLKVMGQTPADTAIANHVSADEPAELSLSSEVRASAADLIVNARVAAEPEDLEKVIKQGVEALAGELGVELRLDGIQSFKPGRPEPVHRISS
ncbi:MAG: GTP-binding protein [Planctomycetota bacterium]|nr:GTP-binding protein [Planctomycetota bacterium]